MPDPSARPSGLSRRGLAGAAVGAVGAAALVGTTAETARAEQPFRAIARKGRRPRPNLLVILADDLGAADLSSYGSPNIKTPNLDRLAASGVRFTQGYSAGAVCSPTRIALYTGRHPGRIPGGLQEPIGQAGPANGIPPEHPTLASLLKQSGYSTHMVGKWHGGFLPWFSPLKSGWDTFYGNYSGGIDYFSKWSSGGYDLWEGEQQVEDPRYYTDIITEKAIGVLRDVQDQKKPWLFNLNFTSPHWPWEGPGDKAVSDEITAKVKAGNGQALFHYDGGSLDKYVEMVENLDRSIGKVLAELERTGQDKDTLILFASDNGGERFSYNWPFTGNKAGVNEGGIRVPAILSWPGQLGKRQVDDTPVSTTDWTATFLELAGASPDPSYPLDGTSLVPHLFEGEDVPERDLFWRTRSGRALRRGDLKYVRLNNTDYLYDLGADVREQANLAAKRPADLAELRSAWEAVNATLLAYA
ncbi:MULTISPECIES: sulfatase-like hydrolase/transferase [unclassified Nocardioides]|jgi:arylsulfatase A-like enzyme|uniref:sulfatase-like hydrolase/transferase n=1 Tax=unclassified Nocardioides TaxID=2615069 RepID=UPI000703871A|nr:MULTISPECIES: sulfatase-like hydrolase/transferase [unclassified Nocardioides]KRC53958.1 twin-arginine translocation pathway signal protein [Nocardioides sp. Root79]KRC71294.1 twin-arginine translocation pathway signal protein [Nocardioides sp. Root240]